MNKRLYGMAPGGRMALDRAANRRRNIWQVQKQARARERREAKGSGTPAVTVDKPSNLL